MVTGASTANAALILIDARKGVIEQTRRHTYIAALLRIPHVIVCVNKMDLVEFQEDVFSLIKKEYTAFASGILKNDLHFIPISALAGDNVVIRSERMDWYKGPALLSLLEEMNITNDQNGGDARFPVQYVLRPMTSGHHDYRGYAGRISGGTFRKGDAVRILPSGLVSKIKSLAIGNTELTEAFSPMSVTLTLEDEIDISRGDMIVKKDDALAATQDLEIMICWLGEKNLELNGKYAIKHTTKDVRCVIREIQYKVNISTLEHMTGNQSVGLNDIAKITIRTTVPLFADKYSINRSTGSLILIDEASHVTVGAGMIV